MLRNSGFNMRTSSITYITINLISFCFHFLYTLQNSVGYKGITLSVLLFVRSSICLVSTILLNVSTDTDETSHSCCFQPEDMYEGR